MGYHLACKTRYTKSIGRTLNTALLQDVTRVGMTFFQESAFVAHSEPQHDTDKKRKNTSKNTNENPILTRHHEDCHYSQLTSPDSQE